MLLGQQGAAGSKGHSSLFKLLLCNEEVMKVKVEQDGWITPSVPEDGGALGGSEKV